MQKLTTDEKKKVVLISMSKNNYTLSKIPVARCFISKKLYDNRNHNFLKGLKEPTKVVARTVLDYDTMQRYIYEVELKDTNVSVRQKDFILPEWRSSGWGGCFLIQNIIN